MMSAVGTRARTRTEDVYAALRADILGGRFRPGDRLGPAALAEQVGASLSVVREALTRLAEQGLVLAQPQVGFSVTPISADDLTDLTDIRIEIEGLALRRSIVRGDIAWESSVVAAAYLLERTPQLADDGSGRINEDWSQAHNAFHGSLMAACGSPRLLEIAQSLRDAAELYRRWSLPGGTADTRDVAGEHRAILDAIQARDADTAVAALRSHIEHTRDILIPAPA